MMIRDVSCCKKTRKDSSAGLCSARITILIVDKMKLIQKLKEYRCLTAWNLTEYWTATEDNFWREVYDIQI